MFPDNHVDMYGTKSGGINSDSYVYSDEKNMLIVIPVILVHNICYVVVTSLHTMYYCTEYAYMITDENRFLLLQIKVKVLHKYSIVNNRGHMMLKQVMLLIFWLESWQFT